MGWSWVKVNVRDSDSLGTVCQGSGYGFGLGSVLGLGLGQWQREGLWRSGQTFFVPSSLPPRTLPTRECGEIPGMRLVRNHRFKVRATATVRVSVRVRVSVMVILTVIDSFIVASVLISV